MSSLMISLTPCQGETWAGRSQHVLWGNRVGGKGGAESSHVSGASVSISLQMPKGVQTRSPFSAFRYTTARAPNPTVVTTESLDSEKNMPSHRTGAHPGFSGWRLT